jgi:hypothetical protein
VTRGPGAKVIGGYVPRSLLLVPDLPRKIIVAVHKGRGRQDPAHYLPVAITPLGLSMDGMRTGQRKGQGHNNR